MRKCAFGCQSDAATLWTAPDLSFWLGLTVTEAAERLGVTGQALNNLVNEKSGISPEMSTVFQGLWQ